MILAVIASLVAEGRLLPDKAGDAGGSSPRSYAKPKL
jgi:hypothetical protein